MRQQLDLVSFEDPVFYDKMERARRQTTSRLGMLASLASMASKSITLLSLSVGIVAFSPWLLLLLIAAVVPPFLGETRFAMLAYSLLYQWTPERRELDYLRMLGASNASAKEVKIFGLGEHLTERARTLFDRFYNENRGLAIKRAVTGTLLNLLPTAGYYAAYAYILYRALAGTLTVGDLTFLTAAFARSRGLIEQIFASFSGIAEQALFIEDLFDFFRTKPSIASRPDALPAPRPVRAAIEFRDVSFAYPGSSISSCSIASAFASMPASVSRLSAKTGREDDARETSRPPCTIRPAARFCSMESILRDYNVDDLRREIGVIFQDYMRYDMRVLENIGFGRIEALNDDERIRQAAAKAYADTVVNALPIGL